MTELAKEGRKELPTPKIVTSDELADSIWAIGPENKNKDDDWMRLTHFTSYNVIDEIINEGDGFKFNEDITITTDPFSENEGHLIQLIKEGSIGPFNRDSFGDHIIIMDITSDEFNQRRHPQSYITDDIIPMSNIRGFIKRNENGTFSLYTNEEYDPVVKKFDKRSAGPRLPNIGQKGSSPRTKLQDIAESNPDHEESDRNSISW